MIENYVGVKINKLTGKEQGFIINGIEYPKLKILTVCECGRERLVGYYHFKYGLIKNCGECTKIVRTKLRKNGVYKKYLRESKKRGIEFKLSYLEAENLFNGNCYFCGKAPSNYYVDANCVYNGIDRLDHNIGYLIENCVSCCWECNRRKNISSEKEFIDWITITYNNLKNNGKI